MSQPIGKQIRSSIFTRNSKEKIWHDMGQIDIASNTQKPIIFRGVHFANSTSFYQSMDQMINEDILKLTMDNNYDDNGKMNNRTKYNRSSVSTLHDFHLYGLEFNQTGIRFFFDDHYSDKIEFDNGKFFNFSIFSIFV